MPRKAILALVAPLLLGAASCARSADPNTVLSGEATIALVRAAPDAAAAAGSGRFEMRVAIDSPNGVFDVVATGGFTHEQMAMQIDLGSVLKQAAKSSGATVPPGFDEPMEIVADGATVYLRMPALGALTGAAGWFSVTPDALGAAGRSLGLGAAATDPSKLLEVLRGVADQIDEVGDEDVRGVATTHVRATIDLDKALQGLPDARRRSLSDQLGSLAVTDRALPVEVWIDGEGLPRRLRMQVGDLAKSAVAASMGVGGTATMTIELFDYGQPVTVVVPDASEVQPLGDLLGAFGGPG